MAHCLCTCMNNALLMKWFAISLFLLLAASSCKTNAFKKSSYHEQYGNKLSDAGLRHTALGRSWFTAAESALRSPLEISLPFNQSGYFSAEKHFAIGLSFQAQRGSKLLFRLKKNPVSNFTIYCEIWKRSNDEPELVMAADTSQTEFELEIEEAGRYILRMQPELLQSGEYNISVSVGPGLGFPVAGKSKIGSFWGAERDGGGRSHEGIDIFAPRRTPALAAADGKVLRVEEYQLGGKVVFFRPRDKHLSLYYAHLDEQLVEPGQKLKAGDTLGLIGNTGNARSTPPHLHFGIYATGGAIDPLAFVDPVVKKAPAVTHQTKTLQMAHRTTGAVKLQNGLSIGANNIVLPRAGNDQFYIVDVPGSGTFAVPKGFLQAADKALRERPVRDSVHLLEQPMANSPRMLLLPAGRNVSVLGLNGGFSFVRVGETEGWLSSSDLK